MIVSEMAVSTAQLTPEQRVQLLARLSFELTIAARNTYVCGSDDIATSHQLRAFNEMQHRLTGCLLGLLEKRLEDGWLWPFLAELSEKAGCAHDISQACSRALASVAPHGVNESIA